MQVWFLYKIAEPVPLTVLKQGIHESCGFWGQGQVTHWNNLTVQFSVEHTHSWKIPLQSFRAQHEPTEQALIDFSPEQYIPIMLNNYLACVPLQYKSYTVN